MYAAYSERAEAGSSRSLQVVTGRPGDSQDRDAVAGTPHVTRVWPTCPPTFTSHLPGPFVRLSALRLFRVPPEKAVRSTGHLPCPGGQDLTTPGPQRVTCPPLDIYHAHQSQLGQGSHLARTYHQLVFPSALLILINLEDKLHKSVISHWCSICLF